MSRTSETGKPEPREQREAKIVGLNAVLALARHRIRDVIRVYLLEERLRDLSSLLRWCAEHKKAYHVVGAEELERVAGSLHHEGVCVLARAKGWLALNDLIAGLERTDSPVWPLFLEDVRNPNNFGAMIRVAANFGSPSVLVPEGEAALSPAVYRTAEGGLESIDLVAAPDPLEAISRVKEAGLMVVATSSHAKLSIYARPLPPRALIVFGSERSGVSDSVLAAADEVRAIPGTGRVESLNVSTASAVVLAEMWRLHRGAGAKRQRDGRKRRR